MNEHFFDTLIPLPRHIKLGSGQHVWPSGIDLPRITGGASSDRDSIRWLSDRLLASWLGGATRRRITLRLRIDRAWNAAGRTLHDDLVDQGYSLTIDRSGIRIVARTAAGLRYGLQTLRQMIENAVDCGFLPCCHVTDWPRVVTRGIHMDLAREMEYRPDHLRRVVENLAGLKLNTLHLYLENKFVFPSAPELAPPRVMTPAQAAELCAYAARYGITVIPQLATMGHMEHLLHGRYAALREDPQNPYNLCPSHPQARPFLASLIADVAAAFQSPFIHVGYDESHSGVCPRCRTRGNPSKLLADHLNWLNSEVKRHNARTMIYGDKFLSRTLFPRADAANGGSDADAAAALRAVNRDIIITDWHYTAPYAGTVAALVREGFEVHMASATNVYWHDAIPLHRGHHWIVDTHDQAIRAGARGVINTNWEFYRGQAFDNYWFFQGLVAERGWTDDPHDFAAWGRRFASRFWGVNEDYYSELGGLVETLPTGRRRFFLDSHVLAVEIPSALNPLYPEWRQIRLDYPETGRTIIRQADRFRKAARRNADTLRLLDIHGWIVTYLGVRAVERERLIACARRGDRDGALNALTVMRRTAAGVGRRLNVGFREIGCAVQDRRRLRQHLDELDRLLEWIRGMPLRTLRKLEIESLIEHLRSAPQPGSGFLRCFTASELQTPSGNIRRTSLPDASLTFQSVPIVDELHLVSVLGIHGNRDGVIYLKTNYTAAASRKDVLLYGADGPVKLWVNGSEVDCRPEAANPARVDQFHTPVRWRKGRNELLFALNTNQGKAWGIICRCQSAISNEI